MPTVIENPALKVFERWAAEMEPVVGAGNYSMSSSKTLVDSDKYARIFMMGNPTTSSDLAGDECGTTASFQTDSFATGQKALTEAYNIDGKSHEAMVGMGFRRTYGPEEMENIDSNIKRITSRYSRVYTGQLLGE